jgi:hypothetical protein
MTINEERDLNLNSSMTMLVAEWSHKETLADRIQAFLDIY